MYVVAILYYGHLIICIFSSAFVTTQDEGDNTTEPVADNQTIDDDDDDDNELTRPFIQSQRQQLVKTAKRYQTRKTQQKPSASLIRSQSLSLNASISISQRLQNVSREYRKQNTLTRSRSNTATSVRDDGSDTNVPYHTIIIDCAPITFVDSMGTRALYQVIDNVYSKV